MKASFELKLGHFQLSVEFSLPRGVTALVGPNGAGKTSLLQTLTGLHRPQKGSIHFENACWFDSKKGLHVPTEARHVGYVPQNAGLFPHLNVQQNVAFGVNCRGKEAREVEHAIEMFQLASLARQMPSTLSGGEKQRVALARALAVKPRLLLLDEPLAAQDVLARRALRELLRKTFSEVSIPVLWITHDAQEASSLAQKLLVLENGRLTFQGSHEEAVQQQETAFLSGFLRHPLPHR